MRFFECLIRLISKGKPVRRKNRCQPLRAELGYILDPVWETRLEYGG